METVIGAIATGIVAGAVVVLFVVSALIILFVYAKYVDPTTHDQSASASGPTDQEWKTCDLCERWPAITITVRSTRTFASYRPIKSTPPTALCKECGLAALHHAQKVTAIHVATGNFYGLYALKQNRKCITRLQRLPDPVQPNARNVQYDLTGWEASKLDTLKKTLEDAGIVQEWSGSCLTVSAMYKATTDELVYQDN